MKTYIPWIAAGVVVIGAVVLINKRSEELAPTNFRDNPQTTTPQRSTTQEFFAGLGTLAGSGIAAYREREARRLSDERLMDSQAAEKRAQVEAQNNRRNT